MGEAVSASVVVAAVVPGFAVLEASVVAGADVVGSSSDELVSLVGADDDSVGVGVGSGVDSSSLDEVLDDVEVGSVSEGAGASVDDGTATTEVRRSPTPWLCAAEEANSDRE